MPGMLGDVCVHQWPHPSLRSHRDKNAALNSDLTMFITKYIINKLPIKSYRHEGRGLNLWAVL